MRYLPKIATLSAIACLLAPTVEAATRHGFVPANKSTIVGFFRVVTGMQTSCQQPARPTMMLEKAPQHGTVVFHWAHHKLNGGRDACKNMAVGGWEIIYTPARGYHGPDSFRTGAQFAQYVEASGSSYASDGYDLVVK